MNSTERFANALTDAVLMSAIIIDRDRRIDAFAQTLTPFPLFGERLAMKRMGSARLGLHLILRAAYYGALQRHPTSTYEKPPARILLALWRLYRRSW